MEYMSTVFMDFDPCYLLCKSVSSYMRPSIDHKAMLSALYDLVCKYSAVYSSPNYEEIIFFNL